MWNQDSVAKLTQAVKTFDRQAAESVTADLVAYLESGGVVSAGDVRTVLSLLRGNRYFQALRDAAEAIGSKPTGEARLDAQVRRYHAQALIELGEYHEARRVLQPATGNPALGGEWAEAKGLRGRSYKQEYMNEAIAGRTPSDALLNAAIREYADVYAATPLPWHGINIVALIKRAHRDGFRPDTPLNADTVARDVLKALEPTLGAGCGVWHYATAAEAHLALGEIDQALDHFRQYVAPEQKADAFEIASTLRQLEEVWQLKEGQPGGALLPVLRTALLQRTGGTVDLAVGELQRSLHASEVRSEAFEKVFGAHGAQTLTWYRQGLARARAVARVETLSGRGYGSGFLVRAGDVFPALTGDWKDELLLMTNAHVLGNTDPSALRLADAAVRFEALEGQKNTVAVKEIVWESPSDQLDATIVRLASAVTGVEVIPLAPKDEPTFSAAQPRRLYIIGHPQGGELSVSIDDNLQVGWKLPRLHYRTPTEPGSSGSPVFDDQWRLLALHHSGSTTMPRLDGAGVYEANEGIWIHGILAATRNVAPAFESATPAPRPVFRQGVFISYSHRDKNALEELTRALAPVVDEGLAVWDDRRIQPGVEWEREIEKAMENARVAVLLVSTNFLASPFIKQKELSRILEASRERGLTVFWVPVGASLYERTPLAKIQAAHDPKRPLNTLSRPDREQAWVEIAKRIADITDLNRLSSALQLADQVVLRASGLGGQGVTPSSVTARQTGESIQVKRGVQTVETITAMDMGQLDPASQQLIRAHEAAIQRYFDEYTEVYPNRAARDVALRARAEQEIDDLRRKLCEELNQILDFIRRMGKQLDDHYYHVRQICGQRV